MVNLKGWVIKQRQAHFYVAMFLLLAAFGISRGVHALASDTQVTVSNQSASTTSSSYNSVNINISNKSNASSSSLD
jgi:hypothetical protein